MDIRKMPPQELANRYLAIQSLVLFYTPEEVEKLNPSFVETIEELIDESAHGQDFKEVKYINLMYCMFKAPSVELQHIIVVLTRQEGDKVKEIADFLDATGDQFDLEKFTKTIGELEQDSPKSLRLRELVRKVQETKERTKIKQEQEQERQKVQDAITKSNQEIDKALEDLDHNEDGIDIDATIQETEGVTRNLKVVH